MSPKKIKQPSLSDKLASLIDPTPAFDPEEDIEEDTRAKLTETFDDDEEDEDLPVSKLRRQAASVTLADDERYAGKKVARKDLDQSSDDDSFSGEGEEEDEEDQAETSQQMEGSEDDMSDDNLMESSGYQEGEDDEEESDDDDDDDDEDKEGDMFPSDEEQGNGTSFKHFSKDDSSSDAQKGASVKNQLLIWDNLLEFRIQMQKTLKCANQMPIPENFPAFKSNCGKDFEIAQNKCVTSVRGLVDKLNDLQEALLAQNPETKKISTVKRPVKETHDDDDDDEEIPSSDDEVQSEDDEEEKDDSKSPPKKKRRFEDFGPLLTTAHKNFLEFRNNTIQKWSDKTRIAQGKFSSKNFSAFEQSTLKQIEHILADKSRLLKRTRTRRSNYRILGTEDLSTEESKDNSNPDDTCNEIFDDDDFYHQLLRELIEHKSEGVNDPIQLGRQWVALQKYRSKMKRKIDTRATKGRKIRYTVIPKLVNFMAPCDKGMWSEEAKDELFSSLFAH